MTTFRALGRLVCSFASLHGGWSGRIHSTASMNKISPFISLAHLEPAHQPSVDPFNQQPKVIQPPALTPSGHVDRRPERVLRRRMARRRNGGVSFQYLVR